MDRDALIKAMQETAGSKPVAVEVKPWGTVYVRLPTVAEVEEQPAATAGKEDKNRLARAAARVICDEAGKRLLDPDNEVDVALLASQPWLMLRELLTAAGLNAGDEAGN